jgi:hypothetical protein
MVRDLEPELAVPIKASTRRSVRRHGYHICPLSRQQSVTRLAQYRPFQHDGLDARAAMIDLVLAAALEADGQVPSLRECQENCKTLWGLDVEIDELRAVLEQLVLAGRMTRTNGHFALTEPESAGLADRVRASAAAEARAFEDWEIALRVLRPGLSDADVAALRTDLDAWLERLIARHGVEAALILYPEVPRAQQLFAQIEQEGLDFLPRRDGLVGEIREQALYLFVRQPTEAQRTLLATLLNTSYFLTILSLDPSAGALVQELTRGQRIYLDTNFVYRVLNLQGPRQFLSSRRLLNLTQELGYETAVTPWTVNELKTSLERARDFLMKQPLPPAELADLAASATTDENFVTAYWRRIKEHPVSPRDFYEFYAQIEDQLAEHGITLVDEGCSTVDKDQRAIDDELSALERALGQLDRHEEVKLHDVKHRLLVRRLRGTRGQRRFSNAGYWFLTCDSLLPRYDQAAPRVQGELPFCASASAWFQVMRSFTPRTEDFDQTLADLLASPFIRYRGRISYRTVEEVVARIDLYEGRTPELAAKVLLDTALMRDVAAAPEEERRRELIDNAIVRAAAERERELAESMDREAAEREARRVAEARQEELAAELEAERAQREDAERIVREERERIEREKNLTAEASEAAIRHLKEEQEELREALGKQSIELTQLQTTLAGRRRVRRLAISGIVLAAAIAGAAVPLALGAISGAWPVTLVVLGAVGVSSGALVPHVGHKKIWAAIDALGVVLGIILAAHELAADAKSPQQPPAQKP